MRHPIYIPQVVLDDIIKRVGEGVAETLENYESAEEDEDTITGDLGAMIRTRRRKVLVEKDEIPGIWTWSLTYTKFRGRGPGATERYLGADGIFEMKFDRPGDAWVKSLLFQSKKAGEGGKALVEQCVRLSTWREAAFVISYGHSAITAHSLDDVLGSRGRPRSSDGREFADYVGNTFAACMIGDNDLRYDAKRKTLIWRDEAGDRVGVRFALKHKFGLGIHPPNRDYGLQYDREIDRDHIHQHRMDSSAEDRLRIQMSDVQPEPRQAARQLAKSYHPDGFSGFPIKIRETVTVRMQEINDAADKLRKRRQ